MVTYDKKLYKILGEHLRKLREEKKYSQEYVGDCIGKTKKTISRYENGEHRMDVQTIYDLANLYGADYNKLMKDVQSEIVREQEPIIFTTAEDAMKFIIGQPMVAAYGGYDLDKMSDEEIVDFANTVLQLMKVAAAQIKK